MDWLSHAYLASFIQHVSIFILCKRWHVAEKKKNWIKWIPDSWERAKSGKTDASCDNLILDHDLRTKVKMGKFLKAARPIFVPTNVTRMLMWASPMRIRSVSYQHLIELDGFSWHDRKSRILEWHLSSVPAYFCSSSEGSEFWGRLMWDGNMQHIIIVPATLDKDHVLGKVGASLWLALQRAFMHLGTVSVTVSCGTVFCISCFFAVRPQ